MQVTLRAATIATLPGWMRKMAGVQQSPVTDLAVTAGLRVIMALLATSVTAQRSIIHRGSPGTAAVVDPMLCGIAPKDPTVYTPDQAYSHHGFVPPAEQYAQIKADRAGQPVPAHAAQDGSTPLLAFQ